MGAEPAIVGGRFRLHERLGAGAAAEVFRAVDVEGGSEVAVKLAGANLPVDESRTRFDREAAALAVLVSPHVVELIAAGVTEPPDSRPFLVLELLRGRTVQEEIDQRGPIDPAEVTAWFGQAAAALDLAHGVGIVHRDLKPANLFLHDGAGERVLKVLDFGLVRDVADRTGAERVALVGTPLYMAPEQVRRQAALLGPETDVWALAMIAVTLLTGESYWEPGSAGDVLAAIAGSPITPPSARWPWLPVGFDRWFARLTHRVPERRYRGVVDQAAALTEALRAATTRPGPAPRVRANPDADISPLAAERTLAARTPTPALIRGPMPGARPLIGRDVDLAMVADKLQPGAVVTLTGPAGVGKSRLAEAVAAALSDRFPDGSWFASLTGVQDQAAAAEAVARALELAEDGGRPVLETLGAALAARRALLVLDGLEGVPAAGELVSALRRMAGEVGWLLVSRVPVGIAGEQRMVLEPLELPPTATVTPEEASRYAAVQLFLRCAPLGFGVTEDNVEDVVEVCRIADGLPLALELAAAQVRGNEVGGVRRHLQASAAAAEVDSRDPVRAAIAWSYGLLAEREQAILRCLAIMPAGVTFRGAQTLLGGTAAAGRASLATAILRLIDSGLLRWSTSEPPRLLMLDSVRDTCRAASAALGEDAQVWRLALSYLERIVARADEGLRGAEQGEWLAVLDAEHDNLLAGLARTLERDPQTAMRIAARLDWYWYLRGHYQEGARWLEAAMQFVSGGGDRLRALLGAGRLAFLQCRYDNAAALLGECREMAGHLGHVRVQAEAEQLMGSLARERGDYAAARRRHWRSLGLWQQIGDRREAARTRNYLAFLAWLADPAGSSGDEDAPWRLGEAEAELVALGDREGMVWALLNRGAIAHYRGDPAGARAALGRAFATAAGARFQEGIAWSLDLIGLGSLARGELIQARAQLHASLRVHRRLGDRWRCASVLEGLAALTMTARRPARAAIYLGAADAIREQLGAPVPPCERPLHADCVRRGEDALGGEGFTTARERGRRTTLDAALVMVGESP